MRTIALSLLLVLPLFAGCMGGEDPSAADGLTAPAASAEEAGATAGPAPSAPKEPYRVAADEGTSSGQRVGAPATTTAYPVAFHTNPAKDPIVLDFSGEFDPLSCGTGLSVPLPGAPRSWRWHDFRDTFSVGDVFSYSIQMRYNNTESNWAEAHMSYGIGGQNDFWSEPTGDTRGEVVMNFTGQGYRVDDDDMAWVAAMCWYGFMTQPIPYTLTVTLTFAEAAVPAGAPVLLRVPENATRLFARGVAVNPDEGVNSHYRVFGPDDGLLCECALNTNQEVASFALPGPGDYVLIVDHTSNGFVSFALDAPPAAPLRALQLEWTRYPLVASDGGAVDKTVIVELPSTPLLVGTWVAPPGMSESRTDAGTGKGYSVTVTNGRGDVIRQKLGGFATYRLVVPGALWTQSWYAVPFPDSQWEFFNDHHAYDLGAHQVHVKADAFRGEAFLNALHYVRP